MDYTNQVLKGVLNSAFSSRMGVLESTSYNGNHWVLTFNAQVFQIDAALELIKLSKIKVHNSLTYACYATSAAATLLSCYRNKITIVPLKNAINFLHKNIGTIAQIASVVASVALVILGYKVMGGVSLFFLLFGALERHELVPKPIAKVVNFTGFWGTQIARLASRNYGSLILVAFEVGDKILSYKAIKIKKPDPISLSNEQIKKLKPSQLVMNRHHVQYPFHDNIPLPPLGSNPNVLLSMYQSINWNNYKDILTTALSIDDHWKLGHGNGMEELQYLHEGVKKFVAKSKNSQELEEGAELHNLAHNVAHLLAQKKEEAKLAHAIIVIGLAGHYCDFEVLHTLYDFYRNLKGKEDYILYQKLLEILAKHRGLKFDKFFSQKTRRFIKFFKNNKVVTSMYQYDDLHNQAMWVNIFGKNIGHPSFVLTKTDRTSVYSPMLEKIASFLFMYPLNKFWKSYDPVEIIRNALTIGDLDVRDVQPWYLKKKAMNDEVFDPMTGLINDHFLRALLVEHHILKKI